MANKHPYCFFLTLRITITERPLDKEYLPEYTEGKRPRRLRAPIGALHNPSDYDSPHGGPSDSPAAAGACFASNKEERRMSMENIVAIYDRATPLHDVAGRIDYISNPDRQERLEAVASTTTDPLFWKRLAADSQSAWKQSGGSRDEKHCCEAREVQYDLPNSAKERDLQKVAEDAAKDFKKENGVDCCAAVHWNKKENNLHFHIVFSERKLLPEPVIQKATRNVFIDENGIRKRTQKEILDENGELRRGCKIIPKGEIISERYFGDKDKQFAYKTWLKKHKQHTADWINENLDPDKKRIVFDQNSPYLAQIHVGKGRPPEQQKEIEETNKLIRSFNGLVRSGFLHEERAQEMKTYVMLSPKKGEALRGLMHGLLIEFVNNKELEKALEGTVVDPKLSEEEHQNMLSRFDGGERTMFDAADPEEEWKRQTRSAIRTMNTTYSDDEFAAAADRYDKLQSEAQKEARKIEVGRIMDEDETYRIINNELIKPNFTSSKTGRHYKTNLFDENGRKRSLLELVLLLAVTVIKAELGLWEPVPARASDTKGETLMIRIDWKSQRMLDAIRVAREEQIDTPNEIEERLHQAGSTLSRANSSYKKTYEAKAKMEPLNKAIKAYRDTQKISDKVRSTPKGEEKDLLIRKHVADLKKHLDAKKEMQKYGVETEEQIMNFEGRYSKITSDLAIKKEKLNTAKKRYSQIKRLQESTLMAQYEQYCYGPLYVSGRSAGLTQMISVAEMNEKKLQSKQEHEKNKNSNSSFGDSYGERP